MLFPLSHFDVSGELIKNLLNPLQSCLAEICKEKLLLMVYVANYLFLYGLIEKNHPEKLICLK